MKITNLRLENVRSHVDTVLEDLPKIVVIRGDLNSGKSSIEMAIEVALTGAAEITDDKGSGQADLIRSGQDKSAITLTLDESGRLFELRCSITRKSGRTLAIHKPDDPGFDPAPLREFLRSKREVFRCLLNNRYFVGLKPDEQKHVLASIILPERYDWPQKCVEACSSLGLQIPWTAPPFTVIETAYKQAYDKRTGVNRALKGIVIPEAETQGEVIDVVSARARFEEARDLLSDMKGQKRAFLSAWEANCQVRNRDLDAIKELRERLSAEQQDLKPIAAQVLSDEQARAFQKLAKNAERAEALDAEIKELAALMGEITARKNELEGWANAGTCPTCKQPTTTDFLQERFGALITSEKKTIDTHRLRVKERSEIGDFETAKKKLADHKTAEKDAMRIRERIAKIESELSQKESALAPEPGQMPDTEKYDAKIAEITSTVTAAEERLMLAVRREEETRRVLDLTQKHEQYLEQLRVLENMLVYFGSGPASVKSELIEQHVGGFVAKINAVLEAWSYKCALSLEPYGFFVYRLGWAAAEQFARDLHLMSGSEQYRFSIAFQVALASVTGIRMLVVDTSDILTPATRGGLMAQLMASEEIDQIIFIGTDERREVADFENVAFFYVEDTPEGAVVERLRAAVPA